MFADGNDSPATFESVYEDPATSIFTVPDLSFRLYVSTPRSGLVLVTEQRYIPQPSALWAKHSEDTPGLQAEIGQAAMSAKMYTDQQVAAEAAARQSGDQLFGDLAGTTAGAKVTGILDMPILAMPQSGQVLVFVGSGWLPMDLPSCTCP